MIATNTRRPEITMLTEGQKSRILNEVRRKAGTCPACGGREFIVGDALYLGFLYVSENLDAYMIALTCTNPGCPAPRTGTRLPGSQFL